MSKLYIIFVFIFFTSALQSADFRFSGKKRGPYSGLGGNYGAPSGKRQKSNLDENIKKVRQTQAKIDSKLNELEKKINLLVSAHQKGKIISSYEEALKDTHRPEEQYYLLKVIAEILMASLHHDQAIEKFTQMLRISKEHELESLFVVEALLALIEAHLNSSNYNILPFMEEAENLLEGDMHFIRFYTAYAKYYAAHEQYDLADLCFDKAAEYLYRDDSREFDFYISKGIYIASTKGVEEVKTSSIGDKIESLLPKIKFTYRKIPQLLQLIKFYELLGEQEKLNERKSKLKIMWNQNNNFPAENIPLPDEYTMHRPTVSKAKKIKEKKEKDKFLELMDKQNNINREIKSVKKLINLKIAEYSNELDDKVKHLEQFLTNSAPIEKCGIFKMLAEIYFSSMDYTKAARNYFELYKFAKEQNMENFWIVEGLLGYLEVNLEILNEEMDLKNFFDEAEKLLEGALHYLKFYTLKARYVAKSNIALAYEYFKYGQEFTKNISYTEVFDYHIARSIFLRSTHMDFEAMDASFNIVDESVSKRAMTYFDIPRILQLVKLLKLRGQYEAALGYIQQIQKKYSKTKVPYQYAMNFMNYLYRNLEDDLKYAKQRQEENKKIIAEENARSQIETYGHIPDWAMVDLESLKAVYPYTHKYDGGLGK